MNMINSYKRILSVIVSVILISALLPAVAFAEETEEIEEEELLGEQSIDDLSLYYGADGKMYASWGSVDGAQYYKISVNAFMGPDGWHELFDLDIQDGRTYCNISDALDAHRNISHEYGFRLYAYDESNNKIASSSIQKKTIQRSTVAELTTKRIDDRDWVTWNAFPNTAYYEIDIQYVLYNNGYYPIFSNIGVEKVTGTEFNLQQYLYDKRKSDQAIFVIVWAMNGSDHRRVCPYQVYIYRNTYHRKRSELSTYAADRTDHRYTGSCSRRKNLVRLSGS